MVTEFDIEADGAVLHAYDSEDGDVVVVWHHGTPNTGQPPRPLSGSGSSGSSGNSSSGKSTIRWISYDRPGYGGSTPSEGRPIHSAATYTRQLADALGIGRFAVMGHSGGAPHALACGALLKDRVTAVVSISSMAPWGIEDYFKNMNASGVKALRSAAAGRAAKEEYEATADEYDPEFIPADIAALNGEWSWFNEVVRAALKSGPAPAIDDDLAYTKPWGFDPAEVSVPVLIVHGGKDRMIPVQHGEWLARTIPGAEFWLRPEEGHISVMTTAAPTLDWLRDRHDS